MANKNKGYKELVATRRFLVNLITALENTSSKQNMTAAQTMYDAVVKTLTGKTRSRGVQIYALSLALIQLLAEDAPLTKAAVAGK